MKPDVNRVLPPFLGASSSISLSNNKLELNYVIVRYPFQLLFKP